MVTLLLMVYLVGVLLAIPTASLFISLDPDTEELFLVGVSAIFWPLVLPPLAILSLAYFIGNLACRLGELFEKWG